MQLQIQSFLRAPSIPSLPRSESVAEQRFHLIDADNSGAITKAKLRSHLEALCSEFSSTNQALLAAHKETVISASGSIDLDATVDKLFATYDVDGNGVIDQQEFILLSEEFLGTVFLGQRALA